MKTKLTQLVEELDNRQNSIAIIKETVKIIQRTDEEMLKLRLIEYFTQTLDELQK